MTLKIDVYDNGDHTCIVWLPDDGKPIAGCRGFAVERKIPTRTNPAERDCYLEGFVGFKDGDPPPAPNEGWKRPVQRYMWSDYGVAAGEQATYRVIPVIGSYAQNALKLDLANASAWSDPVTVTSEFAPGISAYFNRGIIASQWVTRAIADEEAADKGKASAIPTGATPPKSASKKAKRAAGTIAARSTQAVLRQRKPKKTKKTKAARAKPARASSAKAKARAKVKPRAKAKSPARSRGRAAAATGRAKAKRATKSKRPTKAKRPARTAPRVEGARKSEGNGRQVKNRYDLAKSEAGERKPGRRQRRRARQGAARPDRDARRSAARQAGRLVEGRSGAASQGRAVER